MMIERNKKQSWVVANWKMNPVSQQSVFTLIDDLINRVADDDTLANIMVSPSFIHIPFVQQRLMNQDKIGICAQNLCAKNAEKGAFTGEISAKQLQDFGVNHVIIGHSERRQYFGEDDGVLTKKLKNAFDSDLSVIFCIGETHEQYLAKQTFAVIENQLAILADFAKEIGTTNINQPKLLIAYEPIWAIGTGLTPTLTEIEQTHKRINELLSAMQFDVPVLYGGSVNADNAASLATLDVVDGVLVGGASLDADSFYKIIQAFTKKKC